MADIEGFVLFCEDFRAEAGGKNSYMGVLGPKIYSTDAEQDGAIMALANLGIAGLLRIVNRPSIDVTIRVSFSDAPDGVEGHEFNQVLLNKNSDEVWQAQLHINIRPMPIKIGMLVNVELEAEGCVFHGSLEVGDPAQTAERTDA